MCPAALRRALAAAAVLAALSGCASVERIEVGARRDVSGSWNDTDSRLASEQMAREVRAWIEAYTLVHRRPPVLAIGEVRDLTGERVSVAAMLGDLERELVQSRRATLVATREVRAAAREERRDQDYHAAEATRKAMGREQGADFLLTGTLSAIVDRADSVEVRFYQLDLALVDLADSSKAWVGQAKVKKLVRRVPISDGGFAEPHARAPQQWGHQRPKDETGQSSRLYRWECDRPYPAHFCH